MSFEFVSVSDFRPNLPGWNTIGNIDSFAPDASGRRFVFTFGTRTLVLEVLGPRAFRLRFNPTAGASYDWERSIAVVSRDLGLAGLTVNRSQPGPDQLVIDTGALRLQIGLKPFSLAVFRGGQLLHRDFPGQGILYQGDRTAVIKTAAPGAGYVGLGEKAGDRLLKNNFTFGFFNFDNYMYSNSARNPDGSSASMALGNGGPLNPTEPLYCSIPLLIEANPFPQGDFSGAAYSYGIFLDNTAQTFVNVTTNDYSDMSGRYYLGSLYNDLDYYFMSGDQVGDVLAQYTSLTGRAPMPPRYAFGFHQGAYGYYDRFKLAVAAASYRANRIPCDGLHIDVDFQDNYRTFTHSEMKFPSAATYFKELHAVGFKMSTNITPILTNQPLDENAMSTTFVQRENLKNVNALLFDTHINQGPSPNLYDGGVNYGMNMGNNPYPSPGNYINNNGNIPLKARGNYPDLGQATARTVWGQQYAHLLNDLGLDMIWQDMTCPAIDGDLSPDIEQYRTFPQDLMMAVEETGPGGATRTIFLPNAKLHNAYVLNLLRATWEGINQLRGARRNFIIARGGYAGMQRYAALWTGDSASTWDFLRINLPEVLNLGLSGVPMSGCDIGGFAKGPVDGLNTTPPDTGLAGVPFRAANVTGGITNYELLTRWMQLGSFLPWYRNHYDGYNKQFQEPYAYGEPVPTNCRRYIELRYRMLQVYYDAMYHWTQTGMPIARALFLNDPHDPAVYQHLDDQFFIGRDFLVAPILAPHESTNSPSVPSRPIYLPAGSDWYAFMDSTAPIVAAVPGGTTIPAYVAGLDRVPIYIRAGAILPFCELEQWVGELPANPLTFNSYPGPDRWTNDQAYVLYQDDGITTQASTAGRFRVSLVYHRTQNVGGHVSRQLRVARLTDNFAPAAGFFFLALQGSITPPRGVTRDGTGLPDVGLPENLAAATRDAWYWNPSIQTVFVKVFDNRPDTTVTVDY